MEEQFRRSLNHGIAVMNHTMQETHDTTNIEERLRRLERSNRRYRSTFLLLGLCLVALAATGGRPNIPEVIQARRFEVINPKGEVVLATDSHDFGGRLVLRKHEGNGGMAIFANENGGAMGLLDNTGQVVFRAGASTKGGLIVLTNEKSTPVFIAAANDSSNGAVVIYSNDGRERWASP